MTSSTFFNTARGLKVHEIGGNTYKKRKFQEILMRHQWSDCEFIVEDTNFPAHKIVMACNSPVFEAIFFGPMATTEPILVQDSTANHFKSFLEYCYTEHTNISSVEQAWNLVYLSRKYLVDGLENHCDKYLMKNLNVSTLLLSYEQSKLFEKKQIEELTEKEICSIIKVIFLYTTYHPLLETLSYFLNMQSLPIKDVQCHLFLGVVNWAMSECEVNEQKPSLENVCAVLDNTNLSRFVATYNLKDIATVLVYDSIDDLEKHKEFIRFAQKICDNYIVDDKNSNKLLLQSCSSSNTMLLRSNSLELRGTYQISKKNVAYRTPPQKIRERLQIWQNTTAVHEISVDHDCYLTGVVISSYNSTSFIEGNILVTFFEKGSDKKIEKLVNSCEDDFILDRQVRVNFSDIIILRKNSRYYLNVEYLSGQGKEVVAYSFLPVLNAKSVRFTIDDNSYSVLTGLCFYPL